MSQADMPPEARLVRTTPRFTEATVPPALLGAHRVARGTWGQLQVWSGSLAFRFDDEDGVDPIILVAGQTLVIPPERPHRLIMSGEVDFDVAFYTDAADDPVV
jgi:tellurite resistance-related uncharacterized protein